MHESEEVDVPGASYITPGSAPLNYGLSFLLLYNGRGPPSLSSDCGPSLV